MTRARRPRILTLFGTRPEVIKLAPVIRALCSIDRRGGVDVVNVSSGQHADLLGPMAETFAITIHEELDVGRPDQSPTAVCAGTLLGFEEVLARHQPSLVLVQGDTTTALAGAIASFYGGVPVGHVEAGIRSGRPDVPFPEEINRRLIGRMAHLHFAATPRNVENLRSEGVEGSAIILTGNPVVAAVRWALAARNPSPRAAEIIEATAGRRIVLVTTHRRESFGTMMVERLHALFQFANEHDDIAVILPVHPNPNVRHAVDEARGSGTAVHLVEPLGYLDFIALLERAWLVVTDSGGIQEEAPCLGKAVLVIREHTDRPEAVEAGLARLVGESPELLRAALEECRFDGSWIDRVRTLPNPFGRPDSAVRIARAAHAFVTGRRY